VNKPEHVQGLREAHKAERRRQILLAAHRIISEDGLGALTMRRLAQASSLSVPTIYNLVGGRVDVIAALLGLGAQRIDAAMADAPEEPIERLQHAVSVVADVAVESRAVVSEVLRAGGPAITGGSTDTLMSRLEETAVEAFAQARSRGVTTRDADPSILGRRLLGLASGALIEWATDHHDADLLRADLAHGVVLVVAAFARPEHRRPIQRDLQRWTRQLRSLGTTPRAPVRVAAL
jgi:AcrR family transcriptional regulator